MFKLSREEQLRTAQLLCPDVEWRIKPKRSDSIALLEGKGDIEE